LVVDDLAFELPQHPIYVPIPQNVLAGEGYASIDEALARFTLRVYKDFMKLPYFTWFHDARNIVIDGFSVRHDKIYPSIST